MALREGYIIIDGIEYDSLPGNIKPLPERGPRKQTYDTLDLKNITVVHESPTDAAVTYAEEKKVHRQSWLIEWTQNAPCEKEVRDHVTLLKDLQKIFWVQMDDEMSREGAVLQTVGSDYKAYFTPTSPIAPYGFELSEVYADTVYVNGVPQASGFTVTSELGLVRFDTALTVDDVVTMDYSWRAKCRVENCDFQPGFGLAQHWYTGQLQLLQVSIGDEPYNV